MTSAGRSPVLVTGATGRIGEAVVGLLTDAGVPVRALVRRPGSAAGLPAGVEIVTGDLTVPESLDAALRAVDTVFLVWTAPPRTAAAVVDRLATHAQRVVYLSAPHRTPHPFFRQPNPMAALHAEIERLIAATGLDSTIVRPGMFASNALLWWAAAIRADGVIRWPYGAAETAPVDDRDVAQVIARILGEDGHAGGDYVLTGPESLSQAEQVDIIGDALGRPITFEELSPDDFRHQAPAATRPVVDMLLAAWNATLGHPAHVTSTVSDVLGTPPRTFRQWATDHAAAFTEIPTQRLDQPGCAVPPHRRPSPPAVAGPGRPWSPEPRPVLPVVTFGWSPRRTRR
ncbi:NAD(P)H-binding protein [Micromonospora sp. DT233]|uniref:NAD(P)H-binding protein n=1 Tax=Micromonospora sp. DT233 TaxID=3393432 RepID=UPI003CF229B8